MTPGGFVEYRDGYCRPPVIVCSGQGGERHVRYEKSPLRGVPRVPGIQRRETKTPAGRAIQTGRDFYIIIHNGKKGHHVDTAEIAEELGVPIDKWDLIEFDDGVKPMFYWHVYPCLQQIMFDREQAEGYPPLENKENYE